MAKLRTAFRHRRGQGLVGEPGDDHGARPGGTNPAPWGDAGVALCDGLIDLGAGDVEAALVHLEGAVSGFDAIGAPWELGQALLTQGSALRRDGQRRRAAEALDRADAIFAGLGAAPARARAADELGRARPRPRMDHQLTPAETRVAELVAQGATHREAAARLFTTVATVEAHLTRIYAKLEVRSRTELARRLAR